MRISKQIATWALLAFAIAAFSGCGNSPVGPASIGGGGGGEPSFRSGPDVLVVHPDGTTSWTASPLGGPKPADVLPDSGSLSRMVDVVEEVDGSVGAKMRCGRFYLMIPPGAFDGRGSVTMSMEDSTVMICDLSIFPASLNQFHEPVKLALSINNTDTSTDTLSIYWYDETGRAWVDMVCDKDLSNNPETAAAPYPANMCGVMTELRHFSRYSAGKAGW
jgi:hypothetical protein